MAAFANFAEYSEALYRQANAALSHWDLSQGEIDHAERFISEWLQLCAQNATMYPIAIRIDGGPYDGFPYVAIEVAVVETRHICHYYLVDPLLEEESETALACWLKISFLFKMKSFLQSDAELSDDNAFAAKCAFCDAWAILQYIHSDTCNLDWHSICFAQIPVTPYAIISTRDRTAPLPPRVDTVMTVATAVWNKSSVARRIIRESNGVFTLLGNADA